MRLRFCLLSISAGVMLAGCATKTPDWIAKPAGIHCATELNLKCLEPLSQARYALQLKKAYEAEPSPNESNAADGNQAQELTDKLNLIADVESEEADKPEPVAQPEIDSVIELGSLPRLAFGMAALGITPKSPFDADNPSQIKASIELGNAFRSGVSRPGIILNELLAAKDRKANLEAIYYLLATHTSLAEREIALALNALHESDIQLYRQALIARLPSLLDAGDFERANALRETLIFGGSVDGPFSYAGLAAASYTMAGFPDDAQSIMKSAVARGAFVSANDLELMKIAVLINNGSKISPHDFDSFDGKEARAASYVALATIALQLGSKGHAKELLWLGLKQAQKSNYGVDRAQQLGKLFVLLGPVM